MAPHPLPGSQSSTDTEGRPALERRYRRLLSVYPRGHRLTYGEEMVGVLMESAAPHQQRPSLRDATVLLRHATGARLRQLRQLPGQALRTRSPQWTEAAAVFALLGAVLLTAKHAYWLVRIAADVAEFPWHDRPPTVPLDQTVLTGAWLLTTVALALRYTRVGAVLAFASLAGELVFAFGNSLTGDTTLPLQVTSAALAAAAAVLARGVPARRHWSLLGFGLAALALAGSGTTNLAPAAPGLSMIGGRETLAAAVAIALALGWVLFGLTAPVRRRMLVLLAPVAAQILIFDLRNRPPYTIQDGLGTPDALLLFTVAVLTLAAALLYLRRLERVRHLLALGRAAEHRASQPDTDQGGG